MKPSFIKRDNDVLEESFTTNLIRNMHFSQVWHQHLELELVYIVKSKGYKFIGDTITRFSAGDLVLLGSQVTHMWLNHPSFFKAENQLMAEAIVVHFSPAFLGSAVRERAELLKINKLIAEARRGVSFEGVSKQIVPAQLQDLLVMRKGLDRLILLLKMLNRLSDEPAKTHLLPADQAVQDKRFQIIDNFVMNNFKEEVSLSEIAKIVNMNANAFSRFFSKAKGESFSRYVNHIRIEYAKKLLADMKEMSIADISHEAGFRNISNFNVQFKNITGATPSEYTGSPG